MRRRHALAALLAGLLLSGCLSLAPRQVVEQDRAVEIAPGETFTRTVPLSRDMRSQLDWRVHNAEPATRLVACVGIPGAFFPPDDWTSGGFDVDFAGCQDAGATDAQGTVDVSPHTPADHALVLYCDEGGPACRATVTITARSVSGDAGVGFLIVAVLGFVLVARIVADRWDRARIRSFVEGRGGRVEDISWQPFGRGWFGEKGERVYTVKFVDADGQARSASFKTSLFSGVWTDALR